MNCPTDPSPLKRRLPIFLLLLLVFAGGLAFRLTRLADRPMHPDEAVQAAIFRGLWQEGQYRYNPDEFHGPTMIYATLPSVWLGDAETFAESTPWTYRIVPVFFGAGVILLVWLLRDALGKPAVICAAVLVAVSPAMVFYSRYYIHEMLLVFFTLAAIGAGWRYVRSGRLAWCLAAGASIGLMQATKETAVFSYAAAGVAMGLAWLWERRWRERPRDDSPAKPLWHLAAAAAMAVVVAAVLYSSFFTNPEGLIDAALTYLPWLGRAAGDSPHIHPWYFYLHRLAFWRLADGPVWSEGHILALAAVGMIVALIPRSNLLPGTGTRFARWLAFYTLLLFAVYSTIPYKTPWCMLEFLIGMILLAGLGAATLIRLIPMPPLKAAAGAVLLVAVGQLAWLSYRASYVFPAEPCNPYVYAHTSPRIGELIDKLEELTEASPAGNDVSIKVIWTDAYYWPLPWYLRGYQRTELWTKVPTDPAAPLVLSAEAHDEALTKKLDDTHLMTGFYEVRPQVFVQLWVRMDLWEAHLRRLGRI